jgi:hypothetical protein
MPRPFSGAKELAMQPFTQPTCTSEAAVVQQLVELAVPRQNLPKVDVTGWLNQLLLQCSSLLLTGLCCILGQAFQECHTVSADCQIYLIYCTSLYFAAGIGFLAASYATAPAHATPILDTARMLCFLSFCYINLIHIDFYSSKLACQPCLPRQVQPIVIVRTANLPVNMVKTKSPARKTQQGSTPRLIMVAKLSSNRSTSGTNQASSSGQGEAPALEPSSTNHENQPTKLAIPALTFKRLSAEALESVAPGRGLMLSGEGMLTLQEEAEHYIALWQTATVHTCLHSKFKRISQRITHNYIASKNYRIITRPFCNLCCCCNLCVKNHSRRVKMRDNNYRTGQCDHIL